jgi:rSAM/selenodomain-associated transferase 1
MCAGGVRAVTGDPEPPANRATVAVAIVCKTPQAGESKTRLSPPLLPGECAELSRCFIRDLAETLAALAGEGDVMPYAVYTPIGSDSALRSLLPDCFRLMPQCNGGLSVRLPRAVTDLLVVGHPGVILLNSDSPTLPRSILRAAVDAVRCGDNVTLGPATDGGYTLIGLSRAHPALFADIPWSTPDVYRLTVERAVRIGLTVREVAPWYDIDDADSLQVLIDEIAGTPPPFAAASAPAALAAATREFLVRRGVQQRERG